MESNLFLTYMGDLMAHKTDLSKNTLWYSSTKLVFTKKKKKETRRFIFLSFSFDFLFLFLSQINKRDLIFFFTLLLFPFLFLKTYKLQVFAIAWFKIFETLSNNYNTNPLINWSYISNGIYKNILCFLFWES